MKKAEREIYIVLSNEVNWTLCAFCKFDVCNAGESPCDSSDSWCEHPLNDYASFPHQDYGIEPGEDCWGFRACHDPAFAADVVGIVLEKGWDQATWWKNKKGQWKITG